MILVGGLILLFLVAGLVAFWFKKRSTKKEGSFPFLNGNTKATPNEKIVTPDREFTYEELAKYNGEDKPQIYLAVKNIVFDVTSSDAYGPGKGYHCFAGKECTVALAKMSFEEQYMNCYTQPKQPKITQQELETMEQWFEFIKKKYPIIGKIKETKKGN